MISVIISFLNAENFISDAIDSVIAQEFEEWQLILVDDGSTDRSTIIAEQYVNQYPHKIFYYDHFCHVNKGLSASRNLGILKAKGPYIAFLDADDIWFPGYLSSQLYLIEKHQVAMICEATEYWYNWMEPSKKNEIVPVGYKQNCVYHPPQLSIDLYPLGKGTSPCMHSLLIKKDVIERHGGFEEAFTGMYEDIVFLSKLFLNEKTYISSNCNNQYRRRADSMEMESVRSGQYDHYRKRFLLWYKEYLVQQNIKNNKINQLLNQALAPYKEKDEINSERPNKNLFRKLRFLIDRFS